ncbi:MAG: acyclic terpene utilization AtuA family protein [Acidobacteriota bacterium]|nr:acyclic terpene utilization AtuA family protein [Acidobacteriota bacterium]
MKKREEEFRVLSTTAILGYGFPKASFEAGIRRKPHLIAVDAGSTDPGPYYLGAGKSFTNRAAVKRDLRFMLKAGIGLGIPVVIGTAGGSGARPHVDWCEAIIREIAREENLKFRMAIVYADVDKKRVRAHLKKGEIVPLTCVPPLDEATLDASINIVAQMGVEPLLQALDTGCDVILAGRCYDPAVFAAPAIRRGFDPGLAIHMGKILECAAIAATPGSGADCALGTLKKDSFILEALNPKRKFTRASTAAHTLYEKSDPMHLPGPGGEIDLTRCTFTQLPGGRVEVRGSRHVETERYWVKLEAVRRVGYRTISVAGTRDPIMIASIDSILEAVTSQVRDILKAEKIAGRIYFHVYGRDGVMGDLEPDKRILGHELGLVIEAVAPTEAESESLCSLTRSTMLHYGYPGRISTAGNLAFPFSPSDAKMGEVFEFSIYHLMPVRDQGIFKIRTVRV